MVKGQNNGVVYIASNVDVANNALAVEVPDDGTVGVTKGLLAGITSSGNAIMSSAKVVDLALNTATSGSAVLAYAGKATCTFDTTPTRGHYVIASSSAGKCSDGGLTTTSQIIGTVLDTSGTVLLRIGN